VLSLEAQPYEFTFRLELTTSLEPTAAGQAEIKERPMSSKRLFRLAYHASQSKNVRFRIHQLRDGDAFSELAAALYTRGYRYGGLFLNLPPDEPEKELSVDVSSLTSADLLVLNTRPPIHDREEEVNRPVPESFTDLEKLIFQVLKRYFETCSRSHILMAQRLADRLPESFRNRANIMFRMNRDASYIKYREYGDRLWQKPTVEGLTAVYLIQIPHLWENGPGLLVAFGMAGTETLVWNYLLRTKFPEWIDSHEFLMAEVLRGPLPTQPVNLSFADDWTIVPVLQVSPSSETHK